MSKFHLNLKKFTMPVCLLTCVLVCVPNNADARKKSSRKLCLMSYNIHHGEGLDGKLDLDRIVGVFQKQKPDVIAIQELDSAATRTNRIYELGYMGEKMSYYATFGPAINLQGGKYGVGILSREKPISVRLVRLPDKSEPRVLLIAEFENYFFSCTHYPLNEEYRMRAVSIVTAEARKAGKPFFMAGDLNANPSSDVIRNLQQGFTILNNSALPTFPADKPRSCIDYIMQAKGAPAVKVRKTYVVNEPVASDHAPIVSKVKLSK